MAERVGALLSANDEEVALLGYGEHLGDVSCSMLGGMKNPCIKLDNGDTVWGFQCWWGPEERIKREIALHVERGAVVKEVRIS